MRLRLARLNERFRRSIFFLPLLVFVAGFMIVISESAYRDARSELTELFAMGKARLHLMNIVQRVTDAESAQRGYMLTGRKEYMEPYRNASSEARANLEMLRATYAELEHPDSELLRKSLDLHVQEKLGELADLLIDIERGDMNAAREAILSGFGRAKMERVREDAKALLELENSKVDAGLRSVFDTLLFNRIGVTALTTISLLMLIMFLRQSRQLDLQRREKAEAIKAERDQLEIVVLRRTQQLTELACHLQTAREDERARLARDLHDELGATLTAAKLDVARIRPKLQLAAPELMERLTHLTETLNSGIALKRRIIEDLRPSTLSNLGLGPALEILCRESSERLDIHIVVRLRPVRLASGAQLTVFRIVQETLTNIAKYAQAREVEVSLHEVEDEAVLIVCDDGQGFDPAAVSSSRHGLVGMRFRVEAERGRLVVQSAPGAGTKIEACLPLQIDEALPRSPHDS